jgi:hypothetical protein
MRSQTSQNERVDIKCLCDVLSPLEGFCNFEQHNLVPFAKTFLVVNNH